jgi:tetratricopeptide (TPR) repeat protein
MLFRCISVMFFLVLAWPASAQIHDPDALSADPATATAPIAPKLSGLGDHHMAVTTKSDQSQYFFDQGYRLTMAFNHSEALRAFKEAVRLDPENAMAYWGWALVLGPNLNLPMQSGVVAQAYTAMQSAVGLKDQVSPRERAYIEALATRYAEDSEADRAALNDAYVNSMSALAKQYPDDLDAATLYAAAIMNTKPWDYWYRDGSPKPHTETVLAILQSVIDRNPDHAAAHHYLIHTVEAFRPELGVESADKLGKLMPSAGHLVHMPSHIYMRVGRYADSYDANVMAVKADEDYITQCRAQGVYPLMYYPHNIHFMVWSAMFQGRSKAAFEAARQVAEKVPTDTKGNTPAPYETFRSQPMFAMVRFGQWDAMLSEPQPNKNAQFMNGVWRYGRGMASAHKGKPIQALEELDHLKQLQQLAAANESYHQGFASAGGLLNIAVAVLSGEIAAKQGNFTSAITHMEKAVRLEDALLYSEPPDWYFPVRHILGALLLEAGLPGEAEVVYWEDLRRNPENGYSLFGLKQSLLAQEKSDIASAIGDRLNRAWKDADVTLTTSRY